MGKTEKNKKLMSLANIGRQGKRNGHIMILSFLLSFFFSEENLSSSSSNNGNMRADFSLDCEKKDWKKGINKLIIN